MNISKVQNMKSLKGNDVPNQFIIWGSFTKIFQSYQTIIAMIKRGQVYLDKNDWDYSVTTSKYRNQFLGETKKETEKKIKSGEYKLKDLNK